MGGSSSDTSSNNSYNREDTVHRNAETRHITEAKRSSQRKKRSIKVDENNYCDSSDNDNDSFTKKRSSARKSTKRKKTSSKRSGHKEFLFATADKMSKSRAIQGYDDGYYPQTIMLQLDCPICLKEFAVRFIC